MMRIRVEWANCDPAGIIFNPHYYIWMDSGTHALLKAANYDLSSAIKNKQQEQFKGCPLVTSSAQFHTPALLGDTLTLSTTIKKIGNTSFETQHSFYRNGTDSSTDNDNNSKDRNKNSNAGQVLVCSGSEVRVWGGTDENDRLVALRVPDWIRENLSVDDTIDSSV